VNGGVTAVLPVRRWDGAKSRIGLDRPERASLAEAFSRDVIDVLLRSTVIAQLVIVTDEDGLGQIRNERLVAITSEPRQRFGQGLRNAVAAGVTWAGHHRADAPLMVLPADLPSLTTSGLEDAIRQMQDHARAFVPDSEGEGTTLLYARRPGLIRPAYGRGSAQAHRHRGHEPCAAVDPGVRRDVDTLGDLRTALQLGVGVATTAACSTFASGSAPAAY